MSYSNLKLSTDLNNRKILHQYEGSVYVGTPDFQGSYTYTHNLGRIPSVAGWFEPKAGQWYPFTIRTYTDAVPNTFLDLFADYSLTTTTMTVNVRYSGVTSSKTCNILVRVYLDN